LIFLSFDDKTKQATTAAAASKFPKANFAPFPLQVNKKFPFSFDLASFSLVNRQFPLALHY